MAYYLYKRVNANTFLRHQPLTGAVEEVAASRSANSNWSRPNMFFNWLLNEQLVQFVPNKKRGEPSSGLTSTLPPRRPRTWQNWLMLIWPAIRQIRGTRRCTVSRQGNQESERGLTQMLLKMRKRALMGACAISCRQKKRYRRVICSRLR